MEFTAREIAAMLNADIEGDPETRINNLAKIEESNPGTLTFLANPKYIPYIYVAIVIIIVN